MSDDLALTAKQNIKEHVEELFDISDIFGTSELQLIQAFDEGDISLESKLSESEVGRAKFHIGYILGFAVGREQTVEELFRELELP